MTSVVEWLTGELAKIRLTLAQGDDLDMWHARHDLSPCVGERVDVVIAARAPYLTDGQILRAIRHLEREVERRRAARRVP